MQTLNGTRRCTPCWLRAGRHGAGRDALAEHVLGDPPGVQDDVEVVLVVDAANNQVIRLPLSAFDG